MDDDDDDVEKEESIVVVAAAFANITVQILCLETIEIEYCFVCDSPRVACFLRLLLSTGATRDVPMDDEKRFCGKGYIFGYRDLKSKGVSSAVFVTRLYKYYTVLSYYHIITIHTR
jgi:hypothetical protein